MRPDELEIESKGSSYTLRMSDETREHTLTARVRKVSGKAAAGGYDLTKTFHGRSVAGADVIMALKVSGKRPDVRLPKKHLDLLAAGIAREHLKRMEHEARLIRRWMKLCGLWPGPKTKRRG